MKWLLIIMYISPHVTTSAEIPMESLDLCQTAGVGIVATHNAVEGNKTTAKASCVQVARNHPDED